MKEEEHEGVEEEEGSVGVAGIKAIEWEVKRRRRGGGEDEEGERRRMRGRGGGEEGGGGDSSRALQRGEAEKCLTKWSSGLWRDDVPWKRKTLG